MRARLAAIAFLVSTSIVGLCWLSLQPILARHLDARIARILPALLAANLLVGWVVVFVLLYAAVVRPLGRAEAVVDRLSSMPLQLDLPGDRGGPLTARLSIALERLFAALRAEQAKTQRQLRELTDANLRLSRAQTELAASERLATVGKLAAGVAHEVGNPLSGILGYLSLAQARAGADPQLRDFLQRIDAEVQRIDQIVRGLLDLGRSEPGAPAPVNAASLVQNASRLLGQDQDFQRVQIRIEMGSDLVVRAQSGPLAQVIINLLINAAQAMHGEGVITVRHESRGQAAVILVEDTGPGIAPEALAHVFEPFFTTKDPGRGTGLGLAISRHLVESMDGGLEASNRSEGGARFTITLPM